MRLYRRSQTNQGKVLDNCYHVISALETLRSEGHVITNINKKNISFLKNFLLFYQFYLYIFFKIYNNLLIFKINFNKTFYLNKNK